MMGRKDKELLSETESVCPECLSRISAVMFAVGHECVHGKNVSGTWQI